MDTATSHIDGIILIKRTLAAATASGAYAPTIVIGRPRPRRVSARRVISRASASSDADPHLVASDSSIGSTAGMPCAEAWAHPTQRS